MIEVYPHLYVGNQDDFEERVKGKEGWSVVHACKEPYHRAAVGYTTRGAPRNSIYYYDILQELELSLNLIDADDPSYIPYIVIDSALEFITKELERRQNVLVHCNQGCSRSPTIALLYILNSSNDLPHSSLDEAEAAFKAIYPAYNPSKGMHGYLKQHWEW